MFRRMFRGGSWNNYGQNCRSANRYWDTPGIRHLYLGFRLCLSSKE